MLIRKGTRVVFDLEGGRSITAPASYGMMQDPDGQDWPRNSVLVMPYRDTGEPLHGDKAQRYFGMGHKVTRGEGDLPARPLATWKKLGHVEMIWYTRPGTSHPGPFKHKVNGDWLRVALRGKKRAILYQKGRLYRLEFPDGAEMDARGFVTP